MAGLTLVLVARIPPEGIGDFQAYEDAVLPLLARHGGRLERRLRNADSTSEVHIVSFETREGFEGFRADPERSKAQPLLIRSGAATDVFEVTDIGAGPDEQNQ